MLDGTEERQDNPAGETSDEQKGTSEQTKAYTKDSEEKAVQDALSRAGRDAKTITEKAAEAERILEVTKRVQAEVQAEQERWQRDKDEADREAVRHDPEALKSLGERQRQRDEATKLAKEKAELAEKETKHQESVKGDLEEIRVFKRTKLATEVAREKGVSAASILKLTTDDSREAMETIADLLPVTGEKRPPLKTDSGTTLGSGGGIPTDMEQFRKWVANISQKEYEKVSSEVKKMMKEGRIK